ncbi:MAG: IS3 family transposase, partial [Desulfurivibrionaceae bacterium]
SAGFQSLLAKHRMLCSMSRKGDCWDNAPTESFFGSLKQELVFHQRYATRFHARQSIFDYIERFYNRRRLHSTLGFQSPALYEAAYFKLAA